MADATLNEVLAAVQGVANQVAGETSIDLGIQAIVEEVSSQLADVATSILTLNADFATLLQVLLAEVKTLNGLESDISALEKTWITLAQSGLPQLALIAAGVTGTIPSALGGINLQIHDALIGPGGSPTTPVARAMELLGDFLEPRQVPDIFTGSVDLDKLGQSLSGIDMPFWTKYHMLVAARQFNEQEQMRKAYTDPGENAWAVAAKTVARVIGEIVTEALKVTSAIEKPITDVVAERQAVFLEEFSTNLIGPGPSDPSVVDERVRAAYRQATEFGMKAHAFSVATEIFSPFKHLGFGNMAASVADLADYSGLAKAAIGSQIQAVLAEPMKLASNYRARSNLPSLRELAELVEKRELSVENYTGFLAFFGYSEGVAKGLAAAVHREPTVRDLALTLQDSQVEEAFLFRKLQRSGYSDEDAQQLTKALLLKIISVERKALLDAAVAAVKDGSISTDELDAVMDKLNIRPDARDLVKQTANIGSRHDFIVEARGIYETSAKNGVIKVDDLRVALTALGIEPGHVELSVQRVNASLLPRIAREEAAATAAAIRQAQAFLIPRYRELFFDGLIGPDTYRADLVAVGIDDQLAASVVFLDQLRALDRLTKSSQASADIAMRAALKEQETLLLAQFRREQITKEQLGVGLLAIGIPIAIAGPTVERAAMELLPIRRLRVLPPKDQQAVDAAERLRTLAFIKFRKGLIGEPGLRQALLASGEDPQLVEEDVRIEVARAFVPPQPPPPVKATPEEIARQKAAIALAIGQFQKGLISQTDLVSSLIRVGVDTEVARLMAELEAVKLLPKPAPA
jgi:hypothetical protein